MINRLKYLIGGILCVLLAFTTSLSAQDIIAKGGKLDATQKGSGSETVDKLIDNNSSTKLYAGGGVPITIVWQCNTPQTAGVYTLTSANDTPTRDPRKWTFEASQDSVTWTVLDSRSDELFTSRYMQKPYFLNNTTAYLYYRLAITGNNGSGSFQMAEWGIYDAVAPAAPTTLNALATSGAEVYLSWTDNTSIEASYEIERSENGTNYTKIATVSNNVVSYIDTRGKVNTQFYYRVRAVNKYGNSAYSNVKTITTLNYSSAFVDLTDDGGILTVEPGKENSGTTENSPKLIDNNLSTKYLIQSGGAYWFQYQSTTGSTNPVTKYTLVSGNDAADRDPKNWIFQGSNNGSSWTNLDTRTGELFADRVMARTFTLSAPAMYTYYRISVTANNGGSINQITEWQIWALDPTAPAAPEEMDAATLSKSEIALTWEDNASNEIGYEIERSTNDQTFTSVKTLASNTTSYTDANLSPATRYFYRIRALGTTSASVYSNVANDSTLYDANLPLPPLNVDAVAQSDTEVLITWTDHSLNEVGFKVQRSKDGTAYSTVGTVGVDEVSYLDETATLGTHYYYRILAYNNNGNALLYSNIAEVITTGSNQGPTVEIIGDIVTCNTTDVHTIEIVVTPGPETYQGVTVTAESDNDHVVESLSVGSVQNGVAILSYKLYVDSVGTANITVTVKDDGGTLNGGNDTETTSFNVELFQMDLSVESDAPSVVIERGTYVHLTATSTMADAFEWSDGPGIVDGQYSNTLTIHPTQGYDYTVVASTDEGCQRSITTTLRIEGNFALEPMNILTPTVRDGKNDYWVIWNLHTFPGNHVKVFDTSGREVFSMKDYTNDWDGTYKGKPLAEGVYYYIIDLGSGISSMKGALTILHDE